MLCKTAAILIILIPKGSFVSYVITGLYISVESTVQWTQNIKTESKLYALS